MTLHDGELLRLVAARFEQDPIRNTDLADVVQGSRFEQHGDGVVVQHGGKLGLLTQGFGQRLDVVLSPPDVVAGLIVPGFGQRGHGQDGHILYRRDFAGALGNLLLQIVTLAAQKVGASL